jgi:hypothetical protein
LAGTGIWRNLEESGEINCKRRNSCPAGIPAKKSCESGEKQEFLIPPPKPFSCEKFLRKTQEKKISSGILSLLFLSPKNKFLSNRNYQPRQPSPCCLHRHLCRHAANAALPLPIKYKKI